VGVMKNSFSTLPLIPSRPFDELRIFDKGGETKGLYSQIFLSSLASMIQTIIVTPPVSSKNLWDMFSFEKGDPSFLPLLERGIEGNF